MPWRFTLFEFYDPIYEKVDDPSSPLSRPTEWTEETRRYMSGLQDAERSILSPLYKGRPRHWQGNRLGLFLKSAIYRILDHKQLELPWLGHSDGWETANTIRICGKLKAQASSHPLEGVLDKWENWLSSVGIVPNMEDIDVKGEDFQVLCAFPEACGDACMALYTAFIAMSNEERVDAAGFFLPEQTRLRYMRIGKPGEMTAEIQP